MQNISKASKVYSELIQHESLGILRIILILILILIVIIIIIIIIIIIKIIIMIMIIDLFDTRCAVCSFVWVYRRV